MLISRLLNHIDTEKTQELTLKFNHKVIAFRILPMNSLIWFSVMNQNISIDMNINQDNNINNNKIMINTEISGTVLDFCSRNPKNLVITGDSLLAHDFTRVLFSFDLDWEEWLSGLTGDESIYFIKKFKSNIANQLNYMEASLTRNITEYIQEESQQCPTREELNDFYFEVDEIRLATERLEARMNIIQMNDFQDKKYQNKKDQDKKIS